MFNLALPGVDCGEVQKFTEEQQVDKATNADQDSKMIPGRRLFCIVIANVYNNAWTRVDIYSCLAPLYTGTLKEGQFMY